ncbi:hypothetical protein HK13_07520 [Acetobacter indonesiensis]|uniref:MrcB family domain-containing protein n=1 Tax=Acetobacter indonesiensis TaxID=104101 RepID=UPI000A3C9B9E|nr:DUF3578 domain-containing protein [Acetobacter indonesiensis]OUI93304.1 hypothetical protein HK13_07520 [Acetobacter indonesiensis]
MENTLKRICELQPFYSSSNTPKMQERGRLIRSTLVQNLHAREDRLASALGSYGNDFTVDGSDGIGLKTELPWVRFCSKSMSPSATTGFYVVLHFSTDGSGVNIAVGCSSSKFKNGSNIVLPYEDIDRRCLWMRHVVLEALGSTEPFIDSNDFGAKARLPKSFERACALVKKISYSDITNDLVESCLIQAAKMLRCIYEAQRQGRELSPADQVEIEIVDAARPAAMFRKSQGFGLTGAERRAVEIQAMDLTEQWLTARGYVVKNTAASRPYDFEAKNEDGIIFVEVKGTTSDAADTIAMTHGEVRLHKENKGQTALMLVSGIKLHREGPSPSATGGVLEPIMNWDIDTWDMSPMAYRVIRRLS